MDTSTEEIYFQKLQEQIEDEDKIVRCNITNVHINIQIFLR